MSDTSATQATRMQHKCDTNNMNATQVQHEWCTNDKTATTVKIFYFDSDTSKNIFSHPYICYMASERLQGEEQFYFKN